MRPKLSASSLLTVSLLLGFAALTSACELLKEKRVDEGATQCETAIGCCNELNQAGAYNEVAERAGKLHQWPNHCPSWKVRAIQECQSFLGAVSEQRATLEKDHPVYDHEFCQ